MSDTGAWSALCAYSAPLFFVLVQIGLGLLRLGFLTKYLTSPITSALTFAAAIHVFTSQIGPLFGLSLGRFSGLLKLVYVSITYLILYSLIYLLFLRAADSGFFGRNLEYLGLHNRSTFENSCVCQLPRKPRDFAMAELIASFGGLGGVGVGDGPIR